MGQLMTIANRHINAREDTPITIRSQQPHIGLTGGFLSPILLRQSMIKERCKHQHWLTTPYSSQCLTNEGALLTAAL